MVIAWGANSKQSSHRRCTSNPGFGGSTLSTPQTSKGPVLKAMLAIRALTCEEEGIESLKLRVLGKGLGFY